MSEKKILEKNSIISSEEISKINVGLFSLNKMGTNKKEMPIKKKSNIDKLKKQISKDVKKTISSAVANAENNYQYDIDKLIIKEHHILINYYKNIYFEYNLINNV